MLLGLGIELSPAHFLYTGPLLTAMPALAALTMGPVGTLSAAAGALGVSLTTTTMHHAWGDTQIYSNLLGLLVVSAASVMTSNAMCNRRQSELDQIRRIAVAAQEVILQPVPARLGPVRTSSLYLAAETGAQIGGDLYEALPTPYGVRVIVGDVRGKGLAAVRSAAAVLSAFREAAHYEDELMAVMNHCSAALRREHSGPDDAVKDCGDDHAENFVTALVAQVPPGEPVVDVVNFGHPPPLLVHNGKVHELAPTSPLPPLGLEEFVTDPPAKAESYPFAEGDRLLLYTDGVIEARNRCKDFFALPEAIEAVHARTTEEFLGQLHDSLIRHTEGHLTDDTAMIVLERADV
ncbi:PP2C family protein-serine/threonine phosphatase [Streptomyces sp. NPDC058755]|uniref:PP2C family protein-serine/threonine phosphatase n=1 Tax=Streptomyces sp. NPDC058755 TaxID=3346624 RepID=UPI00368708D6